MDDEDELLDLVDEHDKVIGTILRSQTNDGQMGGFLRAAEAYIQNRHGQLWVPRRKPHKRIAPNGLDYSMGEHVKAGEDYLQGCLRGFKEELNLNLKADDLQFVKKFNPLENLDYFRSLYIYHSDEAPQYNTEDFSEYYWLTPKKLLERLKNGEPAKRSLQETVQYLIDNGI